MSMSKNLLAFLLGLVLLPAQAQQLSSFEPDSVEQIVSRHQGKPFVLMLWSLDCVYCKESLKILAEEGKRRKLEVITIATDAAADPQAAAQIRKRLREAGLRENAWAFGEAPPEQLRYAVDPAWFGEIPRSYWYDGRGGRKAHSGAIGRETVAKMLPPG